MQSRDHNRESSALGGVAGAWRPLRMVCTACDNGQYPGCPYCGGKGFTTIAAIRDQRGSRAGEPEAETLEIA